MSFLKDCSKILLKFIRRGGEQVGNQFQVPIDFSINELKKLLNIVLENKENKPYSFYLNNVEIVTRISEQMKIQKLNSEVILPIVFEPRSYFKVRPITHCVATLTGHTEAILSVQFSPDGRMAATGSGDTTIIIWDLMIDLPKYTLRGHHDWVFIISWSPNGEILSSGDKQGVLIFWNPNTGKQIKNIQAHKKWITGISWEPMHRNSKCNRLVTSSKDKLLRIWMVNNYFNNKLNGHKDTINCVRWGGIGFIYSASKDQRINIWNSENKQLVRILEGHKNWINHISLNSDYCLKNGCFNRYGKRPLNLLEAVAFCKKKYQEIYEIKGELLVSASDDNTLYLWNPIVSNKPVSRMAGHKKIVNHVCFSPNGKFIASASFDNSVKLWDGLTGKFQTTLMAHIGAVYQIAWSADSLLLVSSGKDSSLKIWNVHSKIMIIELLGHTDEVFGVDWSPNSNAILSGGKDKNVKIWKH